MQEIWEFNYKNGWIEGENFINDYLTINDSQDISVAISNLGYRDGFGTYQIDDSTLGNPIQMYQLTIDSTLPKYLVEFCPTGGDITYFSARDMPSLIELLNKLAPLAQAVKVCENIEDQFSSRHTG